ncbi:MAG: DUF1553 domain-containing protein [Pirellulales bacterium]|nr:DUF1553 domain-containing protein [Pirellulales bacterium]NLZ01191.1 DUF1553 domain-containing protein [Pirellulaceae bacterium]
MIRTRAILLLVLVLASSGSFAVGFAIGADNAQAAQAAAAASDRATPADNDQVAAARQAYQAADETAKSAEAAVAPLRTALQKADAEYANASKAANTKRQQATDAKNLAGEPGAEALKQAESNLPVVTKALADAIAAKPALDKALADVRAEALPLQQAYEAAEKAALEAEAAAKAAQDAATRLDMEAKTARADAAAKRRAANNVKAALAKARQSEQRAEARAAAAAQRRTEAEAEKKKADERLASAKAQVAAATTASAAAEKAAQDAEAHAKAVSADAAKPEEEKKAAADQAAAKRKAANEAKAALAQTKAAQHDAQNQADDAAAKLNQAIEQEKKIDAALTDAKNQVAAASMVLPPAEEAADQAARAAEQKEQAAAQAAGKRRAAADATTALAQAEQAQQQAEPQAAAAAKKLAELQSQAAAPAEKLAAAEAEKKAADERLAAAKKQLAATTAASQAAQEAAKELIQLDAASKQAAALAADKRKAADAAKAALAPVQQKLEQAATQANAAAQSVTTAEARKKAAEKALEDLKKRIAAAKQSHVADDEAADQAEAVAAPLKEKAGKARAAYAAAVKAAEDKRALANQAKAELYRLLAARRVASVMDRPDPPKPAGRIDEIVFAKLKALGIQPVLCSDAVFVRRAYLDVTGKLPTAEEAKTFIQDADTNKRVALVDRLLEQPTHVDYWAMKWSDVLRIKAEFPVKLWPNAAQAYYRWVWQSISQNKPYDQFARELLTSSGSNFRVGPVNFYRAIQDRTPQGIASAVGLALMGARVDFWTEDRRAGMAAFFSQVGYKPTSEWKEEIVFWDPLNSTAVPDCNAPGVDSVAEAVAVTNQIPQALAAPLSENGPLAAVFPDGAKTTIPSSRDPREVFAEWLIRPDNPWLARSIVNRTWAWAMGRGIIHEPDDIRDDNPPSNPELLAYLEKELISSGYDLKHLKRLIFTSTTYQFSSIPRVQTPEARANFASYLLQRVEAEVLIDMLNRITGSSDLYTSAVPEPFTYIPKGMPAVALADGSTTDSFLTLFGRSARATGMESERVSELASSQWLHMLNSGHVQNKLQSGPALAALLSAGGQPKEIVERLYLAILSRLPTDAEVQAAEEYAKAGVVKGRDVWIDLSWALINSPEFLLRH